jgi:hypothetical protein
MACGDRRPQPHAENRLVTLRKAGNAQKPVLAKRFPAHVAEVQAVQATFAPE